MASEEMSFENVDGRRRRRRRTDGRRRTTGYTISSPISLRLRWAKKLAFFFFFFFHYTHVNPKALGLLSEVEWEVPLDDASCGGKAHSSFVFCFFFSMKQCIPLASQGNLFVNGFDLWQQTTNLRRLRQMATKSVSVCLYTEQACCGSPSRHLGSSSALKYRLRPLYWHDHYSWLAYGWKPTFVCLFVYHMLVMGWCSVQTL